MSTSSLLASVTSPVTLSDMADKRRVQDPELLRIGLRARQLRLAHGWKQREVAERAGISRSYVTQLEGGHRAMATLTLKAVARALEVSFAELVSDVDLASSLRAARQQQARVLVKEASALTREVHPVQGWLPVQWSAYMDLEDLGTVGINAEDLQDARDPQARRVCGDSLRDLRIFDGNVIVYDADPARQPVDGSLVVVRLNGVATVRRWVISDDRVSVDDGAGNVVDVADGTIQRLGVVLKVEWAPPR